MAAAAEEASLMVPALPYFMNTRKVLRRTRQSRAEADARSDYRAGAWSGAGLQYQDVHRTISDAGRSDARCDLPGAEPCMRSRKSNDGVKG